MRSPSIGEGYSGANHVPVTVPTQTSGRWPEEIDTVAVVSHAYWRVAGEERMLRVPRHQVQGLRP